ncbi:hypothetical protein [Plantactinospora sonchi]|uniref:Uncharacterized protein n=1 Tax=Plantactinospora sonchi TaxID=1544735 RepID=A0ABU7RNM1_9ACTN
MLTRARACGPAGRPVRRVVAVLTAVTVLTATAGCFRFGDSAEERARSETITTEIQRELAGRPEVAEVEIGYQNNLNVPGQARVTLTVTRGSDPEPVVEEAVRLLWSSGLHPLNVIAIGAREADSDRPGIDRTIRPDDEDRAALEARYGPRPPA